MDRGSILQEIDKERAYQEEKWGNGTDDTINTPIDFTAYIANYSSKWFPGGFLPYDSKTVDAFRTSMLKTAALAVAAVESIDRQRGDGGSTFYEQEPGA